MMYGYVIYGANDKSHFRNATTITQSDTENYSYAYS